MAIHGPSRRTLALLLGILLLILLCLTVTPSALLSSTDAQGGPDNYTFDRRYIGSLTKRLPWDKVYDACAIKGRTLATSLASPSKTEQSKYTEEAELKQWGWTKSTLEDCDRQKLADRLKTVATTKHGRDTGR